MRDVVVLNYVREIVMFDFFEANNGVCVCDGNCFVTITFGTISFHQRSKGLL